MKTKLRLLHDYNGSIAGQRVACDEHDAKELIEAGIAKLDATTSPGGDVKDDDHRAQIVRDTVRTAMDSWTADKKRESRGLPPIISAGLSVHDRDDCDEYRDRGGFKGIGHYLQDVIEAGRPNGNPSPTFDAWKVHKAISGMSETIDTDGGVLAPTLYSERLLTEGLERTIVRPRAQFVRVPTGSITLPSIDVSSHATNVFGGVQLFWTSEGAQITKSKPKTGTVTLTLNKMSALIYVTDELLEDSIISLSDTLPSMLSQAVGWWEDKHFLTGTGAGAPMGLLNANCGISQAKETGQNANTIQTENVVKMFSRVVDKQNAIWIANHDTLFELATLTLTVGTGGAPVGLLSNQNAQGALTQTLLGRPLFFTEHLPTLGTVGDLICCDLTKYLVGGKEGGPRVNSSIHLRFDFSETAFRLVQKFDGQPWWKQALTPATSSDTLSPIVKLATRS